LRQSHLKHADFPVLYISSQYTASFSNYFLLVSSALTSGSLLSRGAAGNGCRFLFDTPASVTYDALIILTLIDRETKRK